MKQLIFLVLRLFIDSQGYCSRFIYILVYSKNTVCAYLTHLLMGLHLKNESLEKC